MHVYAMNPSKNSYDLYTVSVCIHVKQNVDFRAEVLDENLLFY